MACELLIAAFNKGIYQVGDVIAIKDLPWTWGSKECPPNWIIVCISDASASELTNYLCEVRKQVDGDIVTELGRKRGVTSQYVGIVIAGGKPTITKAQLENFLSLRT